MLEHKKSLHVHIIDVISLCPKKPTKQFHFFPSNVRKHKASSLVAEKKLQGK